MSTPLPNIYIDILIDAVEEGVSEVQNDQVRELLRGLWKFADSIDNEIDNVVIGYGQAVLDRLNKLSLPTKAEKEADARKYFASLEQGDGS